MTVSRSEQIDLDVTPYYHVMNRCVRRSWLCGYDELTKTDYSHRKEWIVDRLKYLSNIFAIKICAYAIMSNHYHVVLYVEDERARNWSDKEVFRRWESIFKKDANSNKYNKNKIKLWRERLTSISWFMRCLNERIARDVNEEDDCKGRFWEGRFKSQALLDDVAVLSAMVYVDLNPIRAGIAKTPETSKFTSIYERINYINKQLNKNNHKYVPQESTSGVEILENLPQPKALVPFAPRIDEDTLAINFKLSDYLELVDYTGKTIRDDKNVGAIPECLSPILYRLGFGANHWVNFIQNLGSRFSYAIGSEVLLVNFSKKKNGFQKSIKSISQTKKLYASNIPS
tara:strand:- start:106366 stop:107391 length:1026 start_codon:yes stop_codon:yes gene_type:complete